MKCQPHLGLLSLFFFAALHAHPGTTLACSPVLAEPFDREWVTGVVVSHRSGRFDDFVRKNDRDLTVIKIEPPDPERGSRMVVEHSKPPPQDSPFRKKGNRLRMWLRGGMWGRDGHVPAGGIVDVRIVKKPSQDPKSP